MRPVGELADRTLRGYRGRTRKEVEVSASSLEMRWREMQSQRAIDEAQRRLDAAWLRYDAIHAECLRRGLV